MSESIRCRINSTDDLPMGYEPIRFIQNKTLAIMSESIRVCGTPDIEAQGHHAARMCQWPRGMMVTWAVRQYVPGQSQGDQQQIHKENFDRWMGICGVKVRYKANAKTANIVYISGRIDGPSGTLGQAYLPCGRVDPHRELTLQLDESENWYVGTGTPPTQGMIDFGAVDAHEQGHTFGLGHEQSPGIVALMDPTYNWRITTPQDWDIAQMVGRYGEPSPDIPPVEPGTWQPARITQWGPDGSEWYAGEWNRV